MKTGQSNPNHSNPVDPHPHMASQPDGELRALQPGRAGSVAIDGSQIERLDSAGAWLLLRTPT